MFQFSSFDQFEFPAKNLHDSSVLKWQQVSLKYPPQFWVPMRLRGQIFRKANCQVEGESGVVGTKIVDQDLGAGFSLSRNCWWDACISSVKTSKELRVFERTAQHWHKPSTCIYLVLKQQSAMIQPTYLQDLYPVKG
jgi:hypothetical protein